MNGTSRAIDDRALTVPDGSAGDAAELVAPARETWITGGAVITMDSARRVLQPGVVKLRGDRIIAVEPWPADGEVLPPGVAGIDATGMIVMPGLVDTHGHAGHGLTKSIGEHLDDEWVPLVESIYYRYSTPRFWRAEAMLAGLERIKFGTTTGFSMLGSSPRTDDALYAHEHMAGHAAIGGRNILGIGPGNPPWPKRFVDWTADGGQVIGEQQVDLDHALRVTEEVVKTYAGPAAHNRLTVQVAPSRVGDQPGFDLALNRHFSDELMRIAAENHVMINGHAYAGNVQYAYDHLGILGPNVILAHCTGLSQREVEILAETGTSVSHGPSTRAYQRERCPVIELLRAGARVAISTDGSGPDRTFDLFKEMRTAMILQRSFFHDSSLLPAGKTLAMVTIEAAQAIGMGSLVGSLEAGKKADVILVQAAQPHLYPAVQPLHRIVYAASGQDVDTVIVDGEVIMRNRKVPGVDEAEILATAHEEAVRAMERAGVAPSILMPAGIWG